MTCMTFLYLCSLHNNILLHCNPLIFYIWHVCVLLPDSHFLLTRSLNFFFSINQWNTFKHRHKQAVTLQTLHTENTMAWVWLVIDSVHKSQLFARQTASNRQGQQHTVMCIIIYCLERSSLITFIADGKFTTHSFSKKCYSYYMSSILSQYCIVFA